MINQLENPPEGREGKSGLVVSLLRRCVPHSVVDLFAKITAASRSTDIGDAAGKDFRQQIELLQQIRQLEDRLQQKGISPDGIIAALEKNGCSTNDADVLAYCTALQRRSSLPIATITMEKGCDLSSLAVSVIEQITGEVVTAEDAANIGTAIQNTDAMICVAVNAESAEDLGHSDAQRFASMMRGLIQNGDATVVAYQQGHARIPSELDISLEWIQAS